MASTKENEAATPAVDTPDSNNIHGSPLTKERFEQELQEALNTKSKFGSNFTTEQIGLGQGFLSIMFRAKLDWEGEDAAGLPPSVVCKVPTMVTMIQMSKATGLDKKMEKINEETNANYDFEKATAAFLSMLKLIHASETAFYNLVNKEKLSLCVPKCYLAKDFGENDECGLIVLEDLCDIASTKPIYEGIPVESLKKIMENLATVHAYSLTHKEWLNNPKLNVTFSRLSATSSDLQHANMVRMSVAMLKQDHPDYFDPLIDRLADSIKEKTDMSIGETLHEEYGIPQVLTHGDLWMNNIMWKKTEDGKSTTNELAALVDWQIAHPGCIGEDFVRLFCSSVSPEVRRENLDELIDYYHATLKTKLGHEPPFTTKNIKDAYKRLFRIGVIMIVPAFGMFVKAGHNMLGAEDLEKRKHDVLTRCKCLIEDMYAYEDGTA
uniref:CHK kinase-like domain-containing protein n=1 Tax=Plectus sambesii TaxID=2011161 RepID=A0A914UXC5_9BILA